MPSRHRRPAAADYKATDQTYDRLIVLILRLSAHRGYDREALLSPMLKKLVPAQPLSGNAMADTAKLRQRLTEASPDSKALAYLTDSAEIELDFARLRLT